MEAPQLQTVDDLIHFPDEGVELIDGEIVKRPMARSEHALVQSSLSDEVLFFKRKQAPGGWWIMTEVSVCYNEHQCPTHDLAGWRKQRLPHRPTGIMTTIPDWVCEITSPGHERKDVFHHFLLLQRHKVPHYWLLSPEDQTLIAYELAGDSYRVGFSITCKGKPDCGSWRIPPFAETEISLGYIFGRD